MTLLNLSSLNPFIRFAKEFENIPFHNTPRFCYDCRLFYIREGNCDLEVENQTFSLSNGMILYFPPGTAYRFLQKNTKVRLKMLVFDFDLVSDYAHIKETLGIAKESNFDYKKIIKYDLPNEFSNIIIRIFPHSYEKLKKIINEFLYKDEYYRESSSVIMKSCLIELLRSSTFATKFKIIPELTKYIHDNYQNSELTNEDIAEKFGYHPYYLSQMIKQVTGETLHSFLLHHRIRVSKDYLITTDLEINTIAWKCGFNSTAHFIRQFKLKTGITPYQFRKSNKNSIL